MGENPYFIQNHSMEINPSAMMSLLRKGKRNMKKRLLILLSIGTLILLGACSTSSPEKEKNEINHSAMEYSSSGYLPKDIKDSEDPAFPVGSESVIKTGWNERIYCYNRWGL